MKKSTSAISYFFVILLSSLSYSLQSKVVTPPTNNKKPIEKLYKICAYQDTLLTGLKYFPTPDQNCKKCPGTFSGKNGKIAQLLGCKTAKQKEISELTPKYGSPSNW